MTQATYQPEERARRYRQLQEQALEHARESRWDEAAEINRKLLDEFPHELSTLNRLGKALSEMGHYAAAKQAYTEALEMDPTNNIARRNLERLAPLSEEAAATRPAGERIDPRLFIEEMGKTGFTTLVDLAPRNVLARLSAGDQVTLQREGSLLYVLNAAGDRIGRVEPRLASRLIKFMEGGNRYAAGIAELNSHEVKLIIRETFQDPRMFGRVSFPAQGGGEPVRGYIKDTMLRYDQEEEDELGEEGEYLEAEEEGLDEEQEPEVEESDYAEREE